MRLRIVGHPLKRMAERGVTRQDIEHAIRHHHTSHPGKDGAVTYVGPGVNGVVDLKIWVLPPGYVDEETTITVKSVAWKT